MSQKLFVSGFKWEKNILEVDVKYPKNLHGLHEDLPFLPGRMKTGKCKRLVCNLYDKKTMLFK